jgi:RNA polymerase sigma factor (sigma-70 family)
MTHRTATSVTPTKFDDPQQFGPESGKRFVTDSPYSGTVGGTPMSEVPVDGARCQSSDLAQAFLLEEKMLRSYIRRFVRDPQDAADILQEVGLLVVQMDGAPVEARHFAGWCRIVARNVIAHFHRSRQRRNNLLAALESSHPPLRGTPEDLAAARELVAGAFDGLDEQSRDLLVIRYVFEENASEIAERLRQSPASVRMRLMRLRGTLKRPKA